MSRARARMIGMGFVACMLFAACGQSTDPALPDCPHPNEHITITFRCH